MTRLDELPPELLYSIFALTENSANTPDLMSLRLVCKALKTAVDAELPKYYHRLYIHVATAHRLADFAKLSGFGHFVTEVVFLAPSSETAGATPALLGRSLAYRAWPQVLSLSKSVNTAKKMPDVPPRFTDVINAQYLEFSKIYTSLLEALASMTNIRRFEITQSATRPGFLRMSDESLRVFRERQTAEDRALEEYKYTGFAKTMTRMVRWCDGTIMLACLARGLAGDATELKVQESPIVTDDHYDPRKLGRNEDSISGLAPSAAACLVLLDVPVNEHSGIRHDKWNRLVSLLIFNGLQLKTVRLRMKSCKNRGSDSDHIPSALSEVLRNESPDAQRPLAVARVDILGDDCCGGSVTEKELESFLRLLAPSLERLEMRNIFIARSEASIDVLSATVRSLKSLQEKGLSQISIRFHPDEVPKDFLGRSPEYKSVLASMVKRYEHIALPDGDWEFDGTVVHESGV